MAALAGAAALGASAQAEAKTYDLAPNSPWNMHYTEGSCSLRRAFGAGDEEVLLELKRYAPRSRFEVRLFGKIVRSPESRTNVSMSFGNERGFLRSNLPSAMTGNLGDVPGLFLSGWIGVDSEVIRQAKEDEEVRRPIVSTADIDAAEDAVQTASFDFEGKTIQLRLGSMTGAMAAMRKCTRDLVRAWGLDPDVQESLLSRPVLKTKPGRIVSRIRYPENALSEPQQGIVKFRLLIDAAGRPTRCDIQDAVVKSTDFGTETCRVFMQTRFKPARAADGMPVAGYYISSTMFQN